MAVSGENTRVQVTIPKEMKKEIEILAKQERRSVSNYILYLLQKEILREKNKKGESEQ